jgi:ABC-type transporter Mla maintaining outer membrane lipid asymmetry ATPase subunit MlaF
MNDRAPLLELVHVHVRVGDELFLDDVDLVVEAGESVAMVVPHARSTILEVAAGLRPPLSGEVLFRGKPMAKALTDTVGGPRLGFVFQNGGLLENTPVFENVALPIRYHEAPAEAVVRERVLLALSEVGLEALAHRFPYQISSGQQRLVALARALVIAPELVFVDDLHRGASVETWDRFTQAMAHARQKHATGFLSVMAVADGTPAGIDRVVRLKKRIERASR